MAAVACTQSHVLLDSTAPSVKVDDDTISRLERLQADIRSRTGNRVTEAVAAARDTDVSPGTLPAEFLLVGSVDVKY
jgi:hypothetical protein